MKTFVRWFSVSTSSKLTSSPKTELNDILIKYLYKKKIKFNYEWHHTVAQHTKNDDNFIPKILRYFGWLTFFLQHIHLSRVESFIFSVQNCVLIKVVRKWNGFWCIYNVVNKTDGGTKTNKRITDTNTMTFFCLVPHSRASKRVYAWWRNNNDSCIGIDSRRNLNHKLMEKIAD